MECLRNKLARDLLKRQSLFAHEMADGSYKWHYGEESIHMMHQYARLTEKRGTCGGWVLY